MRVEFDKRKDAANRRRHRISWARADDFDFAASYTIIEDSQDYGEVRYRSIGFLDAKLYVLVTTETASGIRAISLRKAEPSEHEEYAENFS